MYFVRFYDCKRTAEKKEQKTIEAAGKVTFIRVCKRPVVLETADTCSCSAFPPGHEICGEKNTANAEGGPDSGHHPEGQEGLLVGRGARPPPPSGNLSVIPFVFRQV